MIKYVDTKIVFQEVPDEIALAINISGCQCHCRGCHSSYLAEDIGEDLTIEKLTELTTTNDGITCICFMGEGQYPESLFNLIKWVKENTKLKVAYYTGREALPFEIDEGYLDYLKVGPYVHDRGPLQSVTTNQRFYKKENGKLVNKTDLFWKDWKLINDKYAISVRGEVYSFITSKQLTPFKNPKGYLKVKLYDNGKATNEFVHRLVAKAFLTDYSDTLQINHKDEDKTNNNCDNLEMCDYRYNNNYGSRIEKSANTHMKGLHRKSVIQSDLDGAFIREFASAAEVQRILGFNSTLIRSCCNGKVYIPSRNKTVPIRQAYGYKWKYKNESKS